MHTPTRGGLVDEPTHVIQLDHQRVKARRRPEDIWRRATEHIRRRIGDGAFALCFEGTRPLEVTDTTCTIAAANPLARDWIDTRYREVVSEGLALSAGTALELVVTTHPGVDVPPPVETPPPPAASTASRHDFSPRYSFESFVIGSSNRFAHAAALAVAESPAAGYNPLFIYGGAGLGKTHLLHAIGTYVSTYLPQRSVRYVSTEQFVNEFIAAVQRRTIPEFHHRYRQADVLLIDDIQFLESKERTQEEFFHTFNALHPKSQIVITSDRSPQKLPALEDRLRTRFLWGLIADIQPPDFETRLAILRKKAETENLRLPAEVLSFIADQVQTNIRELEGALIRVAAQASLNHSPPTLSLAQSALECLLIGKSEERVGPDLVISVTAAYFHVDADDIRSPNRSRPLVHARQMAMYLCRELTELSLPQIGHRFGGRDHSTVVHAVNKIRQQMHQSPRCYEQVQELTARLRQQAARAAIPTTRGIRG